VDSSSDGMQLRNYGTYAGSHLPPSGTSIFITRAEFRKRYRSLMEAASTSTFYFKERTFRTFTIDRMPAVEVDGLGLDNGKPTQLYADTYIQRRNDVILFSLVQRAASRDSAVVQRQYRAIIASQHN